MPGMGRPAAETWPRASARTARRGSPRRSAPPGRRRSRAARAAAIGRRRTAPTSPTSSFGVNSSSTPACGRPSASTPTRRLEHRRDGGLVVGAENRPGRVAHDAVLDNRLDRRGPAEPCRGARRGRAASRLGASARSARRGSRSSSRSRGPASSSSTSSPQSRRYRGTHVGNRALVPGRARERGQLEEERRAHPRCPGRDVALGDRSRER